MQDFPPACFPCEPCPHGRKREIFARYGSLGQCDIDQQGEVISQRLKGHHSCKYAAVHPVLPLLTAPEEVIFPWKDRIMGKLLAEKTAVKSFITKIDKMYSRRKISGTMYTLGDVLQRVREHQASDDLDRDKLCMPPWLQDLYQQYISVSSVTGVQTNNYRYAGDGLAYFPHTEEDGYLVSAAGPGHSTLSILVELRCVYELANGVLRADDVSEVTMSEEVLGIKGQRTQGQDYVCVRMDSICELYQVSVDSAHPPSDSAHPPSDSAHPQLQHVDTIQCSGSGILAADISPYIPAECLVTTQDGTCHLWTNGQLQKVLGPFQPRFPVSDPWAQATFGSHPRQILYSDQTAVQMYDLRTTGSDAGVDLFCVPSKFLQQRERIRACARHVTSPFYHVVATDYSLFLMDERFAQYPVLQWDHLLFSPPQYISTVSVADESRADSSCMGSGLMYVGSQYPGDVHGFRFSVGNHTPPQAVGPPWRAAKISDLSQWLEFTTDSLNPDLVKQRLSSSLAGVVVSKWQQGHVVIQMDSYGDLFHQVFQETGDMHQDVTFSAGPGSHDLKLTPVAIDTAQTWIANLEENIKCSSKPGGRVALKDASCVFEDITAVRESDKSCFICNPGQGKPMEPSNTPHQGDTMESHNVSEPCETSEPMPPGRSICPACTHSLKEQQQLVQCVNTDTIMPWLDVASTSNDGLATEFPCDKALSKLLLKHWNKDENIQDILEQKDVEVKEFMKQRREKRGKKTLEDMSESAVLERFQNISQQHESPGTRQQTSPHSRQKSDAESPEREPAARSRQTSDAESPEREPPDRQTQSSHINNDRMSIRSNESSCDLYSVGSSKDEITGTSSRNHKSKSISKSASKTSHNIHNDKGDRNLLLADVELGISDGISMHEYNKSSSNSATTQSIDIAAIGNDITIESRVERTELHKLIQPVVVHDNNRDDVYDTDGSASIFSHASVGSSKSKSKRKRRISTISSSSVEAGGSGVNQMTNDSLDTRSNIKIGRISGNLENVDKKQLSDDKRRTVEPKTLSSLSGLSEHNENDSFSPASSHRSSPVGVLSSSNVSLTVPSPSPRKATYLYSTPTNSSGLFRTFASPLVTREDMPNSPVRVRLADTLPGSGQGADTSSPQSQSVKSSARKLTAEKTTHSTPTLKKATSKAKRKIHIDGF